MFSIVHDENAYASGQLKRPRGPRRAVFTEPSTDVAVVPLSRDIQSEALAYFVHSHLEQTTEQPLLLGPPTKSLFLSCGPDPVLELASSSIALALFSNTKSCEPAAKLASESYQRSLTALRKSLSSPDSIDFGACLLAVCLLGRYEDAVFNPERDSGATFMELMRDRKHLQGLLALLEAWVKGPGLSETPGDAIIYARRCLRKAALFGQIDLSSCLEDGALFGEQGPALQLDRLLVRIIRSRRHLASLSGAATGMSPRDLISNILRADQELAQIDEALIGCGDAYGDIPCCLLTLSPERVLLRQKFLSSRIYSDRTYEKVANRAHYQGYRILVNHLRICALKVLGAHSPRKPQQKLGELHQKLDAICEDLAALTPFGLDGIQVTEDPGEYGDHIRLTSEENRRSFVAELMAGPILIASVPDSVKDEYVTWFRSQLGDMGRLIGYGIMRAALSSHWPVLGC